MTNEDKKSIETLHCPLCKSSIDYYVTQNINQPECLVLHCTSLRCGISIEKLKPVGWPAMINHWKGLTK